MLGSGAAVLDENSRRTSFLLPVRRMRIMIVPVQVFTECAEDGLTANRKKVKAGLALNPIIVAVLNPSSAYRQGADPHRQAVQRRLKIQDLVVEKSKNGPTRTYHWQSACDCR
jgi:aspartate ammonia-lyase